MPDPVTKAVEDTVPGFSEPRFLLDGEQQQLRCTTVASHKDTQKEDAQYRQSVIHH